MEDLLKIGTITTTHGLKGEVKVFPATDPERFASLAGVLLDTGRELKELTVQSTRLQKNQFILKFREIDDINDIQAYKGCSLWIRREDAQELDEDEYYIGDLIDMQVFLEDGTLYGTLTDVIETGANDVYAVRRTDGKEILFPAITECILDVDVENNRMTVHLMKGLEE